MVFLIMIWILNFSISVWNAYAVGLSWVDSKLVGGVARVMAWAGAVMSACGFTWCYLVVIAMGGQATGHLDEETAMAVFKLGYLIIILPILGSGLAIWAESLASAWRERTVLSGGRAGWNTFAQAYNTYQAVSAIPEFISDLTDFFESRDDDAKAGVAKLVILLAIISVIGGIITTASIIRLSARASARQMVLQHARA